jgi:hypothetical protein
VTRHSDGSQTSQRRRRATNWYSVRSVYHHDDQFEERLTLWEADGFRDALNRGEEEARGYAASVGSEAIFVHVCPLGDGFAPNDGSEVFSLMRRSGLSSSEYLDVLIDTGTEFVRTDLEDMVIGELLKDRIAEAEDESRATTSDIDP